MKSRLNRRNQSISLAVLIVVLVLGWFSMAPLALRGQNSYLITSGISMLPGIERGDLMITRAAEEYRVGDVVAYREPTIGAVLHRIIKQEGEWFVLQGDNNDFIDPYEPAESEIMGRMWIHLPGVGHWLQKARQPRNAAVLAVAGGMVFSVPIGANQARNSRRRHGYSGGGASRPPEPERRAGLSLGSTGQIAGIVVGFLAVCSLVLAFLTFTNPTERMAAIPVAFEHQGTFSYSAVSDGMVYDGGKVSTGQPVYRRQADDIAVDFDYALVTGATANVAGTYRMDAVISQDDGWTRSLPVVPETSFSGATLQVAGVLQMDKVQAEIDLARARTGLDSQPLRSYSVALVPTIHVEGSLGSAALQETFAPELSFTVEPLVVSVADAPAGDDTNPFRSVSIGSVDERHSVPNMLALPGYELEMTLARGLAQIGLGLSLAGGLVLIALVGYASQADEPTRIRSRYGPLLISLRGSDLGDNMRLIEVASIDDLVKVAEREGRMVLHQESGSIHQYFVQDVDVTYRYQTRPATIGRPRATAERAS